MNTYQAITTLWPQLALEVALNPTSNFNHSPLMSPRAQADLAVPLTSISAYDSDESYLASHEEAEQAHRALLTAANVSGGWRCDVLSQLEQTAYDLMNTAELTTPQIQTLTSMQHDFAPIAEIDPHHVESTAYIPAAQNIIAQYFTTNVQ